MRITICAPSYAPAYDHGGPIRSLEGLAKGLRRVGEDVRVLTTDCAPHGTLHMPRGWTRRGAVPVKYLHRWIVHDVTPRYLPEAFLLARDSEVVHTSGVFCAVTVQALLAANLAGVATVHSPRGAFEHASLAQGRTSLKRAWIRAFLPLFRRVDCFHATSETEAASVRRLVGPEARVAVVPNGTELPAAVALKGQASGEHRCVIAAMGRVHRSKGFDRLLRAVALLRQRGYDCEVRIAGPLQDREHVRELVELGETLGLGARARLVGELSGARKSEFFTDADVFVLSSHGTENFGNVVIEALGHGLPVVASDVTPWAHLEAEGCGLSVPNSPEGLADGIARVLWGPGSPAEASRRGRALAERAYSWDAVIPQMLALYRLAIDVAAVQLEGESR